MTKLKEITIDEMREFEKKFDGGIKDVQIKRLDQNVFDVIVVDKFRDLQQYFTKNIGNFNAVKNIKLKIEFNYMEK